VGSGTAVTVIVICWVAVLVVGTPVTLTVTVLAGVVAKRFAFVTDITPVAGSIPKPAGNGVAASTVNVGVPVMFIAVADATTWPFVSDPAFRVVLMGVRVRVGECPGGGAVNVMVKCCMKGVVADAPFATVAVTTTVPAPVAEA